MKKRLATILSTLLILVVSCSPVVIYADSGFGRTVDSGKLNYGADDGIVGAWMCIWDDSMEEPPWLDYFHADGTWDEVYWMREATNEPIIYDYNARRWELKGNALIRYGRYGGDEETFRNRTDRYGYTELTRHAASWDFRYIAITDEAYNILKNYKASDWKNFDYITLSKKANIKVPGTTISRLSRSKKAFTVRWKRKSGVSGYQIQYGTKSNFSNAKIITISKASETSKKIRKLKKKKKYYVRVRSFRKLNNNTYYSSWSKKRSVKTK